MPRSFAASVLLPFVCLRAFSIKSKSFSFFESVFVSIESAPVSVISKKRASKSSFFIVFDERSTTAFSQKLRSSRIFPGHA